MHRLKRWNFPIFSIRSMKMKEVALCFEITNCKHTAICKSWWTSIWHFVVWLRRWKFLSYKVYMTWKQLVICFYIRIILKPEFQTTNLSNCWERCWCNNSTIFKHGYPKEKYLEFEIVHQMIEHSFTDFIRSRLESFQYSTYLFINWSLH
jgi:hypothetical protein